MPRIVWVKPGTRLTYVTTITNDPNVPAGYLLSNTADGSSQFADGVTDQNMQTQVAGRMSGGYPAYNGYTDGSSSNGHLGGN